MRLGSPVKLIGIQSRTEVNGQHGVLIDMNANGRYCIRLRSGETMAVRPECCDPVLERAPSEIAVPKFDSLTKPKLNAPTIDLGAHSRRRRSRTSRSPICSPPPSARAASRAPASRGS